MGQSNVIDLLDTMGARLKALRARADMSQGDVEDAAFRQHGAKVNRSYLSLLENGESVNPTVQVAMALAGVYGTTLEFICGRTQNPTLPSQEGSEFLSPQSTQIANMLDALPDDRRARLAKRLITIIEDEREDVSEIDNRVVVMIQSIREKHGDSAADAAERIMWTSSD